MVKGLEGNNTMYGSANRVEGAKQSSRLLTYNITSGVVEDSTVVLLESKCNSDGGGDGATGRDLSHHVELACATNRNESRVHTSLPWAEKTKCRMIYQRLGRAR